MRRRDDDLNAWQDDPVVKALTSPGTESELAGEAMALAAFRAAAGPRGRRRYVGRLGIGGSALAVAVAFSGGVAAAYTGALPSPVQHVVNVVGGWAGIPAPSPARPKHSAGKHRSGGSSGPGQLAAPTPTTSAPVVAGSPTPTPQATHQHAATKPKPKPKPTVSSSPSTASPPPSSPPPTTSPSPTPTPTVTAPVPASITITVTTTRVAVNGDATVIGQLATATGAPVADQRVWLLERLTGQSTAAEIASGLTGPDGSIDLIASDLTHSVRLRLVAGHGVRSAPVLVVVQPEVSVAVTLAGTSYDVDVTTDGGDPGDTLILQRRTATGWVGVTTSALDPTGSVSFTLPAPAKRSVRYRVILPRTQAHGYASTGFVTPPA